MFGRKESNPTAVAVDKVTTNDAKATLEALAVAADPETARLNDELFASFTLSYQRQYDGWSFSCKRWGDFLTVYIERRGQPDTVIYGDAPKKLFSTSVNLASTRVRYGLISGMPRTGS